LDLLVILVELSSETTFKVL